MIYSGSIIHIKKENFQTVLELIKAYPQIQFFTQSEDFTQLVVSIEEESSNSLEALCEKLKEHEEIIEIAHSNFFFGDEVDKMTASADV